MNKDLKEFLENESDETYNASTYKNTSKTEKKNLLDLSSLYSLGKENLELFEQFGYKDNRDYKKLKKKKHLGVLHVFRKAKKRKAINLHQNKNKSIKQLIYECLKKKIQKIISFYYLQNYNPKKKDIQMPYQLTYISNFYLPIYNIFSNNYNSLFIFNKFYTKNCQKSLTILFDNKRNSYFPESSSIFSKSKWYKYTPFGYDNYMNSLPFKIIINDTSEIFCIFSNLLFIKIFCFKYFPPKSIKCKLINFLNIEIKLNINEEKIYAKINKIEFDVKYINKIAKAIDIYELINGIELNKNDIIFIKEKDIFYDIFIFLKIIKFPLYKQIKTVKIIIFEPEQFELMDEYSIIMNDLYGNESPFYEEVGTFVETYFG